MHQAPGLVGRSVLQRPHFAAEVEDFLENRATPDEVARVQRCMQLIGKATTGKADISSDGDVFAPTDNTTTTTAAPALKPRPATTLCFSHNEQQQQHPRHSIPSAFGGASAASATGLRRGRLNGCNSSSTNNITGSGGSSWLYTTTAAAQQRVTAAHQAIRPFSAQPAATGPNPTTMTTTGTKPYRPASAAAAPAAAAHLSSPADDQQVPYNTHQKHSASSGGAVGTTTAAAAAAGGGSSCKTSSKTSRSVNITTSQAMHGLKDLYPDLWTSTVPICRPDAAPNKNFVSEWGESLRQGAEEAWKPYLATTSQLANLQVAKPTDEFAVRADEALIAWAAKQQTHFGDLLAPEAAAAVAQLLEGAGGGAAAAAAAGSDGYGGSSTNSTNSSSLSLPERKELLSVLRQLAAVVQPHRAKSTSHMHHCKQTTVEQPSTTALLKEQTRIRTMGFPRQVTVKGFNHNNHNNHTSNKANNTTSKSTTTATTSAAAAGGGSNSSSSSKRPAAAAAAVRASELIDTQKSRVPLKWAASSLVPPCSTYTSAHGTHPGRSPQMFRTKFREVNVGMGHVDQHMYPPGSRVYPVEALYLQPPARCQLQQQQQKQRPEAQDAKTTYRMSFPAKTVPAA